jgi:hypothetical protein
MAIDKYYVSPFRWSKSVWGISIVTTLALIGIGFMYLFIPDAEMGWERYLLMMLMVPFPAIVFCTSPRYLCLYGNELIIKRWVGRVTIYTKDIISIEEADRSVILRSKRTMGNGGMFGYFGHFYSRLYGKYRMFAGELSNLYLIRTSKQAYVISCENKELINALKEKIK